MQIGENLGHEVAISLIPPIVTAAIKGVVLAGFDGPAIDSDGHPEENKKRAEKVLKQVARHYLILRANGQLVHEPCLVLANDRLPEVVTPAVLEVRPDLVPELP